MKTRESGMPEEDRWISFFDPDFILSELGLERTCQTVVDLGCGYGTFSIPAGRRISGTVYALDIDPQMINTCQAKVDKALRDEGTSYHYLPPSAYSEADAGLLASLHPLLSWTSHKVLLGAAWTTDAPFRETEEAIEYAQTEGILGVEMEAAALYAFARTRHKPVICFAQITNRMGSVENDFEKGEAQGSLAALELIDKTADYWILSSS
jgi:SAM-dependent methyltransferase